MPDKNTTINTLRKARDLIAEPSRWTKGAFREFPTDDDGFLDLCADPCAWCSAGAIRQATGWWSDDEAAVDFDARIAAEDAIARVIDPQFDHHGDARLDVIVSFNDSDGRTHDDIIAVFNTAINNLENGADL